MKIIRIAGARPNFMKAASVVHDIRAYNDSSSSPLNYLLVHTGQHYDKEMSDSFFTELELPVPHVNLSASEHRAAGYHNPRFERSRRHIDRPHNLPLFEQA